MEANTTHELPAGAADAPFDKLLPSYTRRFGFDDRLALFSQLSSVRSATPADPAPWRWFDALRRAVVWERIADLFDFRNQFVGDGTTAHDLIALSGWVGLLERFIEQPALAFVASVVFFDAPPVFGPSSPNAAVPIPILDRCGPEPCWQFPLVADDGWNSADLGMRIRSEVDVRSMCRRFGEYADLGGALDRAALVYAAPREGRHPAAVLNNLITATWETMRHVCIGSKTSVPLPTRPSFSAPPLDRFHALRDGLGNWLRAMRPDQEGAGTGARTKATKGKHIDARMLKVLSETREAFGWTAHQWAQYLACAESTVKESKTWKERLAAVRAEMRVEAAGGG